MSADWSHGVTNAKRLMPRMENSLALARYAEGLQLLDDVISHLKCARATVAFKIEEKQ